ncbi:hypothetical protein [Streptococcus pluranimalium]
MKNKKKHPVESEKIKKKNVGGVAFNETITCFKKECKSQNIPSQLLRKRRK